MAEGLGPRGWLHSEKEQAARFEEVARTQRQQAEQATKEWIPCCAVCRANPNRSVKKWDSLYRCYVCKLWLCEKCAKDHHEKPAHTPKSQQYQTPPLLEKIKT